VSLGWVSVGSGLTPSKASVLLFLLYRTTLYPLFISPLRGVPGPPYAGPLLGHVREIISTEPGTVASEWGKAYGPFVRAVGPLGKELLIPFRPEALAKILVADWENYPRVRIFLTATRRSWLTERG
jgi:hypothetical protein